MPLLGDRGSTSNNELATRGLEEDSTPGLGNRSLEAPKLAPAPYIFGCEVAALPGLAELAKHCVGD